MIINGINIMPPSKKGINSIYNQGTFNIWEGAVRAGKTVASTIAWILYVTQSPEDYFLMTGHSQTSLYRNVIDGNFGLLRLLGPMASARVDARKNTILEIRTSPTKKPKICYLIGAPNARSFEALAGLTVGGWYADEINRHDAVFVQEALNRTVASSDRKHFWTLNPDNPHHWVYHEFIDRFVETEDTRHWHFTLDDNLAITQERKDELKRQYKGIFYKRFILGERCIAEGAIFEQIGPQNFYDQSTRPYQLELKSKRTIAIDYGTRNDCVYLDIYDDGQTIYVDNEYRWSSSTDMENIDESTESREYSYRSPSEYVQDLKGFMGNKKSEVLVDPSASYFIQEMRKHQIMARPAKNDVSAGIQGMMNMFGAGTIKINEDKCKTLIKELETYSWDETAALKGEDKPIKVNDHGVDALRYYVNTCVNGLRTGVIVLK